MASPIRKRSIRVLVNLPIEIERGEQGLFYIASPMLRGLLITDATEQGALGKVQAAVDDFARAYSLMGAKP